MSTEQTTDVVIVEEESGKRKPGRPVGTFKKARDKASFIQDNHDFDKTIKKISKEAEDAVRVLSEIALNKDAEVKERRAAASDILKHYNLMVQHRDKHELTCRIAEYKIRGKIGEGTTEEDDDDMPLLDFDNIPEEFRNLALPEQDNEE